MKCPDCHYDIPREFREDMNERLETYGLETTCRDIGSQYQCPNCGLLFRLNAAVRRGKRVRTSDVPDVSEETELETWRDAVYR